MKLIFEKSTYEPQHGSISIGIGNDNDVPFFHDLENDIGHLKAEVADALGIAKHPEMFHPYFKYVASS